MIIVGPRFLPAAVAPLDCTEQVPYGAWGLRLLDSDWTGNLIELRRSSDNAVAEFGATATGDLDEAAIMAWVGGGSAFATKWIDQSGNGRHMTQTNAANQPPLVNAGVMYKSNGRPYLRLDYSLSNTYRCMRLPAEMSQTACVFAVMLRTFGYHNFLLGSQSSYFYHGNADAYILATYASEAVKTGTTVVNGISTGSSAAILPASAALAAVYQSNNGTTNTAWDNVGQDRGSNHSNQGGYSELIAWASKPFTADEGVAIHANQKEYFV